MLGLDTDMFVVRTRVGAAMGRHEQNAIATRLLERENQGLITQLAPDFAESVDYMRALTPAELGPHTTLKGRYEGRVDDLRAFARSLTAKGVAE
jgi:hypothetical protein